ncbi:CPBP family intramembrane glutamic endopeptidase [Halonatronum saccharophilum]|uniref:CPBP family intramembrane glutamic endopeptidase n=1 Tax=Halonatronum saccharophilum TaxID=150060 RepID=UPI0004AD7CAA|nr:type II CAAX endopeptidase family protein [Halonatronum saccharophilum]
MWVIDSVKVLLSKDNRLFRRANESKYLPNAFVSLLIIILLLMIFPIIPIILFNIVTNIFLDGYGSIFDYIFLRAQFLDSPMFYSLGESLYLLLPFGGMIVGVYLWVRFVERRGFKSLGFEGVNPLKKYINGFIFGAALMILSVIILATLGLVSLEASGLDLYGPRIFIAIFIILLAWVVQGAAEEILIRGWQMPTLGAKYTPGFAFVFSSLIFAIMHIFNANVTLISLINLALIGFLFAFYALGEERLWGVCGFHTAWNFVQGNIFGLEVSGMASSVSLLHLSVNGSEVITGGYFGPEGGLVVTFINIIGILFILWINRSKAEVSL